MKRELVAFIESCAKIGFSRSKQQIITMIQQVMQRKGRTELTVSEGWWASSRRRHPYLTLRKAEEVSYM